MNILASNILAIHGAAGRAWLDALPTLAAALATRLGLQDLKPIPNLSYNYVLSGFQGPRPIVLKLGLDNDALKKEAKALEYFSGCGAVRVLAADRGMILLERARPGTSLKSLLPGKATEAVEVACHVMQRLHRAPSREHQVFPHIKDWLATLDRDWDLPEDDLPKARELRDRLLRHDGPEVLLHGDLHHDNILQHGEGWVAIDPKGVIGPPLAEVWFVTDPAHDIPLIAKLGGFDVQEVADWYFVRLVLAVCWNLEDGIDASFFLDLVRKARHLVG
jgi:streptomycin 6-kinase